MSTEYKLYYWPMLPGRGEFIRLLFEHAEATYIDVGRLPEDQGGGIIGIQKFLNNTERGRRSFALPVVESGDLVISQLPNICLYLAKQFGLLPKGKLGWIANQIQLSICDVINECHNTHHPLSTSLTYEDQKEAARENAQAFLKNRLPRWMHYFESVLQQNGGEFMIGTKLSMLDIQLFQLMRGIHYAFPKHFTQQNQYTPGINQLVERVRQEPGISNYLASDRCIDFNEFGIFRAYPELESLQAVT